MAESTKDGGGLQRAAEEAGERQKMAEGGWVGERQRRTENGGTGRQRTAKEGRERLGPPS